MNKSIYRKILIAAGLLHVIGFFVFPFGSLKGVAGGLGQLAGALGAGDLYPEKLTGFNALKQASMFGDYGGLLAAFLLLPMIMGILTVLLHVLGKKKLSYIGTIPVSLAAVGAYGMLSVALEDYKRIGYSMGITLYALIALAAAQILVALAGCVLDKGGAAAKSGTSKQKKGGTSKQGKREGHLTGLCGSYQGAVIPIKNGETVVIGRDPAVCSIVIKDEQASRKHCEVRYNAENGMYSVTDHSANGTFDGAGNRLPASKAVPMSAGSEIRIGKDGERFRLGA